MFFVLGPLWFVIVASALYYLFSRRRAAAMRPLPSFWVSYPGFFFNLWVIMEIYTPEEYAAAADTLSHKLYGKPFRQLPREENNIIDDLTLATIGILDWDQPRGSYNAMEMVKLLNDDPDLFPYIFRELKRKARV